MSDAMNTIEKMFFAAGDYVFFEGDVENHFYIVESGVVSISTVDRKGRQISLSEVTVGESFGEFAMISELPRSASARAITDVTLIKVSEEGFKKLLSELPAWAECMMKSFVERLQSMTDKIREVE